MLFYAESASPQPRVRRHPQDGTAAAAANSRFREGCYWPASTVREASNCNARPHHTLGQSRLPLYTELNFAAFVMLGRSFCPCIKGVKHQRIYRIDTNRDYEQLSCLVARSDRTIDPNEIAEHWDRMGRFYASLESGHTTASVALPRLVSCSPKNRFYHTNRDLGRVFKTEFLLRYMSAPKPASAGVS